MRRKALFLDRDGVVNVDKRYVHKIEQFEFTEGLFEGLLRFQQAGYVLVVVTNQAGIGRGYYTEDDFRKLTEWMIARMGERGADVSRVYHCPYHPEHGIGKYKRDSFDRKPNPGMLVRAERELELDMERSVLIGDQETDIEAGLRAGVGTTIRIASGGAPFAESTKAALTAGSVREAAELFFGAKRGLDE